MMNNKYEVFAANRIGFAKNEEIKRAMDLLKDKSSNRQFILKDLCVIMNKDVNARRDLGKIILEMDFFSFVKRIFENEKKGDENIIKYLVIVIMKISNRKLNIKENNLYKSNDAIDPLYNIMMNNYNNKIKEDAINIITIVGKNNPSAVFKSNCIKNSYKYILPSNAEYSYDNKKYIYILFIELIKEGIIKKGEEGSEIIEEILYISEMMMKKKDICNIDILYSCAIELFIVKAKEKGFESNLYKDENDIIGESLLINWKELCIEDDNGLETNEKIEKTDVYSKENEEGKRKKEKEKIKKLCDYVGGNSVDIQMKFVNRLFDILCNKKLNSVELKYFNTKNNGLFLYSYFPLLFKMNHLKEILPQFLYKMMEKYKDIPKCYEYLIKLYNEIIVRMMKEEKEIEINDENVMIILFLWSVIIEEGKKENEIEYLINSTVKMLELLGRMEEKKEEEIKEKEKELIKKEEEKEEGNKGNVNRNEIIISNFVFIFSFYVRKGYEKVRKDGRIMKLLLEIVTDHLKNERCIIAKENQNRIIEYIVYSYNKDIDTSNLLSLAHPSFPFSHNTVINILYNVFKYFLDGNNVELIKNYMFVDIMELLNNYVDIMKIINEYDIKKELEGELLIEWNDNIVNEIKKKLTFEWKSVQDILYFYLSFYNLSSFDNENDNKFKKLIYKVFEHNNKNIYDDEKESDDEDVKDIIIMKPFILDIENKSYFINNFISSFIDFRYYSMYNIYYLINESEGCNLMNIFMKELSGERFDRIKRREGKNIIIERRRYERERNEGILLGILNTINHIVEYTFKDRKNIYLGGKRNKEEYKGKEKETKEDKDYISDIMEEEDLKECMILYLESRDENPLSYSSRRKCSVDILSHLLLSKKLNYRRHVFPRIYFRRLNN